MRLYGILIIFLFLNGFPLFAQTHEPGAYQYTIRGEVYVDLEPIYAGHIDEDYPLDNQTAARRALDELALFFSSMIYGWAFHYEPGERARQTGEILELEPLGVIQSSDPALRVTDTSMGDMRLRVWADYHLNESLQRRMQIWSSGSIRNAQATGYSPSYIESYPGWIALKQTALENAAKSAIREMLRGSERNRPKEVKGFISLASFPRYYIDAGRWAVSSRFRVQVTEIVPFAAY